MIVKNPSPRDTARLAERDLAIGYTPVGCRAALSALLSLDARLGDVVRTTREPIVGQMRLTWWHDALRRLDDGPAAAEPVLVALASDVVGRGVNGADLAQMIDGWEALLDGVAGDHAVLTAHARDRGATLFTLAGRLIGDAGEPLATAGEGWALADLASNMSDSAAVIAARALANERLTDIVSGRWSRPMRGLGALALSARMDVDRAQRARGHPVRVARLLRHRLTGR